MGGTNLCFAEIRPILPEITEKPTKNKADALVNKSFSTLCGLA